MKTDRTKRQESAKALRELRDHHAWGVVHAELSAIRDALDRRLLSLPLSQTDNTLRYTRHDLERETRRVISNFLELPEDLLARFE